MISPSNQSTLLFLTSRTEFGEKVEGTKTEHKPKWIRSISDEMEKSNMEYRQNRAEMYPMEHNLNVDGTKLEHATKHKIAQRQNTCAKFPTQWNEAVQCTLYSVHCTIKKVACPRSLWAYMGIRRTRNFCSCEDSGL